MVRGKTGQFFRFCEDCDKRFTPNCKRQKCCDVCKEKHRSIYNLKRILSEVKG